MRQILAAEEYARALQTMTNAQLQQAAAATVNAAQALMARHGLHRAVILSDGPLEQLARLILERLGERASLVLLREDDLSDLDRGVICDLLFGTDEGEMPAAKHKAWIEAMAQSGSPIVSVAIPAGVDPDTGRAAHTAVCAEITVVPVAYLPGLFLHDGLDHCGEIRPVHAAPETGEGLFRFEAADAKRLLPRRKRTAHKGDSGKALLCVGSPKYVGAALLSARACLAAGCGILFVACPHEVRSALWRLPEAIGVPVGADWNEESCKTAIDALPGMRALGVGCGIGNGDIWPLLQAALQTKLPLVLDADGLNCLSKHRELYPLLHERVVLTPHPGEMGRLTGLPVEEVLDDPVSLARDCAFRWGCTVLLKGAATAVSDGKRTCLVAEGNAGLGKGGSGDVLTGIITGLLSQGVAPFDAACLGSYLLGTSADKAFELLKERMLRATHVIEALRQWNE